MSSKRSKSSTRVIVSKKTIATWSKPPSPATAPHFGPPIAGSRGNLRLDGWASVISGMGIKGRDKRMAGQLRWDGIMPEPTAEEIYSSDELARRMAELVPAEATRQWIKFKGLDETTDEVETEMYRLKAREQFYKAWVWAQVYGGSALFMATGEPDELLQEPLDPTMIDKVHSLVLFSRWELMVRSIDIETDINDPNYGQPRFYHLVPRNGNVSSKFNIKIHHTRLIRFDGKPLPLRLTIRNNYWGDSIYTGVIETLRDYSMAHAAIAGTLQEFRLLIYKADGLAEMIASGQEKLVAARLAALNAVRSTLGAWYMDKESEDLDSKSETYTGVEAALDKVKDHLQSHTEIPHIVLFNESPSGLGATGHSSLETWYNLVESKQETYLAPKITQLVEILLRSPGGPTKGQEPKDWDYEFNALWQASAKEQAETEKILAEADQARVDQGVFDAVYIMEKRYPELLKGKDPEKLRQAIAKAKAEEEAKMQAELETRAKAAAAGGPGA